MLLQGCIHILQIFPSPLLYIFVARVVECADETLQEGKLTSGGHCLLLKVAY
jgi:hypothetical protein